MDPVHLFKLASDKAQWLATRQTAVANNIANANTPGYGAMDVEPFQSVLDKSSMGMTATNAGHISTNASAGGFKLVQETPPAFSPDGAPVRVEKELARSAEIRHEYELNTAIVKSFHRMLLQVAKS